MGCFHDGNKLERIRKEESRALLWGCKVGFSTDLNIKLFSNHWLHTTSPHGLRFEPRKKDEFQAPFSSGNRGASQTKATSTSTAIFCVIPRSVQ